MNRDTRPISWFNSARKQFLKFPVKVQETVLRALDIAAEGQKADISKPLKGLGSGVFEIALKYKTDAFRAVYAVKLGDEVWVIHVFQKKSKTGTKTPKEEIDIINSRLKWLKENIENE